MRFWPYPQLWPRGGAQAAQGSGPLSLPTLQPAWLFTLRPGPTASLPPPRGSPLPSDLSVWGLESLCLAESTPLWEGRRLCLSRLGPGGTVEKLPSLFPCLVGLPEARGQGLGLEELS